MKKLSSTSLMISDWVKWEDDGDFYQISEISDVIEGEATVCFMGYNYMTPVDEIKPIPLTAEILEKNGLCISEHGECFKEDEHCMVEISVDREGIKWTINCHEYCIMTFRYVHELQNALRLAGVKKEIKL